MATPVKNITYLTGGYGVAPAILLPLTLMTPRGSTILVARLAPKLWKPIRYAAPQAQGPITVKPRPLQLLGWIALVMTPFWRSSSDAIPIKGQRYPLSR